MRNLYALIKPYFTSEDRVYARLAGSFLVVLSLSKVYCGYLFTQWNKRFFDAIEAKDFSSFMTESLYFAILALIFVFLFSFSRYMCQRYALRWRVWMTNRALKFWLPSSDKSLEGADQRIQEDLMRFTDIVERFSLEMINNIVLIICFTPLLFQYTKDVNIFGHHIPGLLFYVVIVYTMLGLWISKKIGNPLVDLEYDSQKYEANLRYKLVQAKDGKYFCGQDFSDIIKPIVANHISLYKRQKKFNLWQKGYDQFSFLIPYMILGPSYFQGIITLGALMQIKSIFSRIRNAMAYILDHYTEFMELMAIAKRLTEFYEIESITKVYKLSSA